MFSVGVYVPPPEHTKLPPPELGVVYHPEKICPSQVGVGHVIELPVHFAYHVVLSVNAAAALVPAVLTQPSVPIYCDAKFVDS